MSQLLRIRSVTALILFAVCTFTARGEWSRPHAGAGNNPLQPIPAQLTNVNAAPLWGAVSLNLPGGATPTILPPYVFHPVHDAATTRVTVVALNAETGGVFWESDPLDVDNTINYLSATSTAVDPETRALYFASGNTVYRLDADTGSIVWATELTAANTTPGLSSYEIINSSPQLGNGMVFIETFGGFVIANKQLVALDQTDGSIEWFVNDVGPGTSTPAYVESGADKRVYSVGDLVVRCYDADDGSLIWDSLSASPSWATSYSISCSPVVEAGRLFVGSLDFFNDETALYCADADTGALLWQETAPTTDCPPLVIGDRVFVYGGLTKGTLASFAVADGTPGFSKEIFTGYVFRDYPAAAEDAIYLCGGGDLVVLDPADGSELSRKSAGFFGPVCVDSAGGVYAHNTGALEAYGITVPVELSEFTMN